MTLLDKIKEIQNDPSKSELSKKFFARFEESLKNAKTKPITTNKSILKDFDSESVKEYIESKFLKK